MSDILNKIGISPEVRKELALRDKAMAGDIVMVISPATVAPLPTAAAWTRTVSVELQTAAGELHSWLSAAIATKVSIADTSALGTATIASTTLTLVNGRAEIVVTGSAHAWADTETDTLTIANLTVLGYTVTGKTSVETFTA